MTAMEELNGMGTLMSTSLITFQFDVTGRPTVRGSFVGHKSKKSS